VKVRPATPDDAAAINAVYNPFILGSPATFETLPWDNAKRRGWIEVLTSDPRYPVFVAESGSKVCGFASAAPFDPRQAYGTSVKTSVFVVPRFHGQGVARALYSALLDALGRQDLHRAYGLIAAPNPASVALHEAFGFTHISTLDEVGRKFGRYYSVMWFEKRF